MNDKVVNRHGEAVMKVAIGLGALLIGLALGRWIAAPAPTVAVRMVLPNESAASAPSLGSEQTEVIKSDAKADHEHSAAGTLAHIVSDHTSGERLHNLTEYVDGLAPGDFGPALLAAHKLSRGSDRDLASRLLVARWAEVDPEGALAFAASHKDFDEIAGEVFENLAAQDLPGSLTRAQAMTDPALRYQALRGVLGVMAEQDPAGALRLAATAEGAPHSEPLTQMIYRQWSAVDPQAAAAAAVQDSGGTGWRSPLGQVLRTWAGQDPQGALNYALTMSDPSAQARSIGEIVRRWSDQDPGAVGGWINSMPSGSVRDAAVAAFASAVASTDLPTAVGWAQSIGDETTRTSALQRVSRRVLWRDPDHGAATLQSAGVPAEILQDLPPRR